MAGVKQEKGRQDQKIQSHKLWTAYVRGRGTTHLHYTDLCRTQPDEQVVWPCGVGVGEVVRELLGNFVGHA